MKNLVLIAAGFLAFGGALWLRKDYMDFLDSASFAEGWIKE